MSDEFTGIKKGQVASISQQWERLPSEDVSPTAHTPLRNAFGLPATAPRKLWPGEALVSPARGSLLASPFKGNPFAPREESLASFSPTNKTARFRNGSTAKPTPHFTVDYTDDVIPEEDDLAPEKVLPFDQSVPHPSPISRALADSQESEFERAQTVPLRLFGPPEHIDPMLKAFAIQDNAEKCTEMESSRGHGREGIVLARGTWAWLHRTQQGQREWLSNQLPCAVCHATPGDGVRTIMDKQFGFCSSLNLTYNDSDQYAWSFGSRYVVLEKQYWNLHPEALPAEVWATRLLKQRTKAPVPDIVAAWKEGNVAITITERAKGKPLADMWNSLSQNTRSIIAAEVAGYVKQWRVITCPSISALDGSPYLNPERIIGCSDGLPTRFETEAQYRDYIQARLTEEGWNDEFKDLTLRLMPGSQPFVFTHGNLTLNNIFINEGHVSSIVGLDCCAFLPVWAESLAVHFAYGTHEREWKEALFCHIAYPEIKAYWNVCQELQISKPPDAQHGDATARGEAPSRRANLGLRVQEADLKTEEHAWEEKHQKRKGEMNKKSEEELKARLATMVEEKERKKAEGGIRPETAANTEGKTELTENTQETDFVQRERHDMKLEDLRPKKNEKKKPIFFRQMKPQRQPKVIPHKTDNMPTGQQAEQQSEDKGAKPLAAKEHQLEPVTSSPAVEHATRDATLPSQAVKDPNPSASSVKARPVPLPLTHTTMEATSRLSSLHVKKSGLAQESFPGGFHLYKTSGTGNECALRAVYKSFGGQYPETRGFMTMQALRESLAYITRAKPADEGASNEQPISRKVQYWINLSDAFDYWVRTNLPTNLHDKYRLGCIVLSGGDYAEWWPAQAPSGDRGTVWVFRGRHSPDATDEDPHDDSGGACYQGVFAAGGSRGSGDAGRRQSQLRDALTPRFDEGEVRMGSAGGARGSEAAAAPGPRGVGVSSRERRVDVPRGVEGGSVVDAARRRTEEYGAVGSSSGSSPVAGTSGEDAVVASWLLAGDLATSRPLKGSWAGEASVVVAARNDKT